MLRSSVPRHWRQYAEVGQRQDVDETELFHAVPSAPPDPAQRAFSDPCGQTNSWQER
jgi:hypothetical protein